MIRLVSRKVSGRVLSTKADRELQDFVRAVTNERERVLRRELPRGYCGGRSVYFATCFIQPNGVHMACAQATG